MICLAVGREHPRYLATAFVSRKIMLNSSSVLTEPDDEVYSVVGFIIGILTSFKNFSLHSFEEVLYYPQKSCDLDCRSFTSRYGVRDRSGFFFCSKKLLPSRFLSTESFVTAAFDILFDINGVRGWFRGKELRSRFIKNLSFHWATPHNFMRTSCRLVVPPYQPKISFHTTVCKLIVCLT